MEVSTLLKNDISPVTHINELGPQQDFVNYSKPALKDSPIDKRQKLTLTNNLTTTKIIC